MKLILSLDGGGVRERFTVEVLAHIENSLQIKISQVFDMVVGVSAGAIAAAIIAEGSYNDIHDALLDSYEVFREKNSHAPGLFETMYSGDGKRAELKRVFKEKKMSSLKMPIALLTVKMQNGEAVVFTEKDVDADSINICNVVDASSAAPVYFPAVKIKGESFIDGGFVNNDPVFVGIEYAKRIWPNVKLDDIAIFSIGTGIATDINIRDNSPTQFGLLKWLSEGLLTIMTDSRRNYNESMVQTLVGKDNYLRITSKVVATTDDLQTNTSNDLSDDAGNLWTSHGSKILDWLVKHSPHLSSKRIST